MDKEERKQYNKVYYSLHRERILSYLCEKVSCEYCGRCVIRNNLAKHEKSNMCKKTRERNLELSKWNLLKQRGELAVQSQRLSLLDSREEKLDSFSSVPPLTPMLTNEEGVSGGT